VVRIIAICTQPVLLIVSWVTRNLFIGVDGLDVRAGAVLLAHHGRGAIVGRFGGSILDSHVGCGKRGRLGKGACSSLRARRAGEWSGKEEEKYNVWEGGQMLV
jgi:hypothetical protein